MKYFISPEHREELEKKIVRMTKNWAVKPVYTFSEVIKGFKTITIDLGEDGYAKTKYAIEYIEFDINDICANEWVLVAEIDFANGVAYKRDKMFKDMPEGLGLEHTTCDHCGRTHIKTSAYVVYNKITQEWRQVDSTCLNKLVNGGKYLAGFFVKLYEYIKMYGGCEDGGFGGWIPSDKYMYRAISVKEAFECCNDFYKNVDTKWKKAEYNDGIKVISGTNDYLMVHTERLADDQLFDNVCRYVDTLEGGLDWDGVPDFNAQIKQAFADEWIELKRIYLVWFAMTKYINSISSADYLTTLSAMGIEKGAVLTLECDDIAFTWVRDEEDYFNGGHFACEFTCNGIKYIKSASNKGVFDKYKNADGGYKFKAEVKYISTYRQEVGLGGRLKKA